MIQLQHDKSDCFSHAPLSTENAGLVNKSDSNVNGELEGPGSTDYNIKGLVHVKPI